MHDPSPARRHPIAALCLLLGCGTPAPHVIGQQTTTPQTREQEDSPAPLAARRAPSSSPSLVPTVAALAGPDEVALFRAGEQVAILDRKEAQANGLMLLDVARAWAPALFRAGEGPEHAYESTFVALSNGQFPDTPEGRRAAQDRYLELYGIPPTPALLGARLRAERGRACHGQAPGAALMAFDGVAWDEDGDAPAGPVPPRVVEAIARRLVCDGHLRPTEYAVLDVRLRRALAELERRHRIYARGSLEGETLSALKTPAGEMARQDLARVLTERLLLDLGVIEDGSAIPTPAAEAADDIAGALQQRIEDALGLHHARDLVRLHEMLAAAFGQPHYLIALDPVALPEYHEGELDLRVEIDRGDVYYDFPYDDQGLSVPQPVTRRPTLSVLARVDGQSLMLARFGTTIGGWRIQRQQGQDVYVYKESPVGPRIWNRIVSAPVWIPPANTPPASLVMQTRRALDGELIRELNTNVVGPGYGSAFGLVAAYHRSPGAGNADEGIRTHGSSDYTSVWRRASLGCHRLHNHRALRLFSFILAHRAHRRAGHQPMRYHRRVHLDDFEAEIDVQQGGYAFQLQTPIPVRVLAGDVRGTLRRAPSKTIPVAQVERARATSAPPESPP